LIADAQLGRFVTVRKDQDFLEFVVDQLSSLRRVTSKRMFGGIGLYQGEHFFAIIDDGRLYFLTSEGTRRRYRERGMKAFEYAPGKIITSYYEVPVDVLEDDGELCQWALEAVGVQRAKKAPKRKARTKSK
jgi:DNA transformation protein